ncbi:MAG: chemotaxis protein CheA [bacterium]|nr:chemotaxis protein CheA [bacterium]
MSDCSDFNKEFLDLFIFETGKYLDEVDGILLAHEKEKEFSEENISDIFRVMHTIKSTSAMMGYDILSAFAHKLEDLFSALRAAGNAGGSFKEEIFDLLFSALEAMRGELKRPREDAEGTEIFEGLTIQIDVILDKMKHSPARAEPSAAVTAPEDLASVRIFLEPGCAMANIRAYIICSQLRRICKDLSYTPENLENDAGLSDEVLKNGFRVTFPRGRLADMLGAASGELYVQRVEECPVGEFAAGRAGDLKPEPSASAGKETSRQSGLSQGNGAAADKMINVYLSKLDKLQDITGELVIAESIAESALMSCDGISEQAAAALARLKKLTDAMRSVIMSIRMTSISDLFQKMHRVVRDTARKLGKEVEFEAEGTDIVADKRIIDALSDVLSHVVRNALTHGIESGEERLAMGKPAVGKITMTARSTGNGIIITVSDDGRGVCLPQVLEAARKKGVAVRENACYTNSEILQLLMTSGVTTSATVDEYSGRGVGLDALNTAVKKMRGAVSLETEEGRGSSFVISIPQTLAIMDCIKLESSRELYMLPVPDVYKIVVPEKKNLLDLPDGKQKLLFQGYTIPLLRLDDIFALEKSAKEFERGIIVVIEGEQSAVGIYADKLMGQQKVVIKPMPPFLRYFDVERIGISGCTILGDGSVSLIIDAETMLAKGEEAMQ